MQDFVHNQNIALFKKLIAQSELIRRGMRGGMQCC